MARANRSFRFQTGITSATEDIRKVGLFLIDSRSQSWTDSSISEDRELDMSEKPDTPEDGKPEEVPPPPPIMPNPDIVDPKSTGPTYGKKKDRKRGRKEKKRSHPLDPYEP